MVVAKKTHITQFQALSNTNIYNLFTVQKQSAVFYIAAIRNNEMNRFPSTASWFAQYCGLTFNPDMLIEANPQPIVFPCFKHVNRYWDPANNAWVAKILPGEFYVVKGAELISTVLGSCVSACIFDPQVRIGGMNHFMLPENSKNEKSNWTGLETSLATRYGNFAMEHLVNMILSNGGNRQNLQVKIFGGGQILSSMTDIGLQNIKFVEQYIQSESMNLVSKDIGDVFPRKVYFNPSTGRAWVKKLRSVHNNTIVKREEQYRSVLEKQPVEGQVLLF